MKQAIKNQLKRIPFVVDFARKIGLAPAPLPATLSAQIQQRITEVLNNRASVYFVQVGSNDGLQGDPLHDLIVSRPGWQGIFVEPVVFLFERLKDNYNHDSRFIFENIAISSTQGIMPFYYVSEKAKDDLGEDLPYWYDQLGSFDKTHILNHLDGMLEPYIVSTEIKTLPLCELLQKHGAERVDLLHIDTEGHDFNVLSTFDFSSYQPDVVLLEHKHLSNDTYLCAQELLKGNGYSCQAYGGDTLAIR